MTYDKIILEERVYIGYLYYPVYTPHQPIEYMHTFIPNHHLTTGWWTIRTANKTSTLGKIHNKWVPLHDCQYDKDSLVDLYPWEKNKIEYTYDVRRQFFYIISLFNYEKKHKFFINMYFYVDAYDSIFIFVFVL